VFQGDTVLTFEDTGAGDIVYGVTGFHADGISIYATDQYLFGRANGNRNGYIYGSQSGGPASPGAYIQVDLLNPDTMAFGAHLGAFFVRTAGEVKVTLSTGEEFLVPVTGLWADHSLDPRDWDKPSYFGVISSVPLSWIRFEMISTDYYYRDTDILILDNIEFGYSDLLDDSGEPGGEPFCGDGVVDPDEGCDDANNEDGDGCSSVCVVEPFCGDGVVDPDEECDDANDVDGDGCSSICVVEVSCGDGVVDPDEGCDDGNVADGDGCSSICAVEAGSVCVGNLSSCFLVAVQSEDQRDCIKAMNKYGAKLARAWNKNAYRCIKYAGKGKVYRLGPGGNAESCLTADVRNRVARREERLLKKEDRECLARPQQLPDYAYMGSEAVMLGADEETWGMLADVFGDPNGLNDVVVSRKDDRDAAKCQYKTYKNVSKLYYAKMRTFVRCKRNALKGKYRFTDPHEFGNTDERKRVESVPELQAEILACVAADPKGRIARAKRKLERKVLDKCELDDMDTPLADVFPGDCAEAASAFETDPGAFMDCLDEVTEHRLHTSMNAFDGLTIDCP
jgi:cysteine-rich repeat protein